MSPKKESAKERRDRQLQERRDRVAKGEYKVPEEIAPKKSAAPVAIESMHSVFQDVIDSGKKLQKTIDELDAQEASATPSETVPLPPVERFDYPQRKTIRQGSETDKRLLKSGTEPAPEKPKKASTTPSGTENRESENVGSKEIAGSTTPSRIIEGATSAEKQGDYTPNSTTPSGILSDPVVEDYLPGQQNHSATPSGSIEKASTTPSEMVDEKPSQVPGVAEAFDYPQRNRSTTPSSFDPKAPKKPKTVQREIELLKGKQLEFMKFVFDLCSVEPPYRTPVVKLLEIARATDSSENLVEFNYKALRKKGLILRAQKDGPIVLEIPANIFTLVGKKVSTTPQQNRSTTPSGIGSYARAVVVADLGKTQKSETASVGATSPGTPGPSNEDQARARQSTSTPTTTENPKSRDAKDWQPSDYRWAFAIEIPEVMKQRGFRQVQMLEFERYGFDPGECQRSVEDFGRALELGYDKKRKWKSPIAVFLEAMRDKGYYSLDTSISEDQEQKILGARLDDIPFG